MADVSPLVDAAPMPSTPSAADAGIEALRRLNRTAPAPLVSRARKARLVGERKPVSAVFADIVGSTALAESIDPEDGLMDGPWPQVITELPAPPVAESPIKLLD